MNKYIYIRGSFWGTSTKMGTPTSKNRVVRDLKLKIFGAEGADNFKMIKGFKEKLALFGVLVRTLTKFESIW